MSLIIAFKKNLFILLSLFIGFYSHGDVPEAGEIQLGFLAGQFGLTGNTFDHDPNTIGFGGQLRMFVVDDITAEFSYILNDHEDGANAYKHSQISLGGSYLIDGIDMVSFYARAGAQIHFAEKNIGTFKSDKTGFGLYLGGSIDFDISPFLGFGLLGQYQLGFEETDSTFPIGEQNIIGNSYLLMANVYFRIPTQ